MEVRKSFLKNLAIIIGVLIILAVAFWFWPEDDDLLLEDYPLSDENYCNALYINLRGVLLTYIDESGYGESEELSLISTQSSSDYINSIINEANKDPYTKAIVLEIDSYGGSPVAGEEIANALKRATKPTVAFIREAGVSSAYWAATGADTIFASENSDIGGIGVTMSYLDNVNKNYKEGLTYNQLSIGKFKDTSDPDKPLTYEEKELLMRDVKIIYENFIKAVAENRNLDIEKVRKLADGSSMLGKMALDNGLIDKIGGLFEVKQYLEEQFGGEEIVLCEYD